MQYLVWLRQASFLEGLWSALCFLC